MSTKWPQNKTFKYLKTTRISTNGRALSSSFIPLTFLSPRRSPTTIRGTSCAPDRQWEGQLLSARVEIGWNALSLLPPRPSVGPWGRPGAGSVVERRHKYSRVEGPVRCRAGNSLRALRRLLRHSALEWISSSLLTVLEKQSSLDSMFLSTRVYPASAVINLATFITNLK